MTLERAPYEPVLVDSVVVVPCYNEERRLDVDRVVAFASVPNVRVLLVNDGSTDDTQRVLESAADRARDRVRVLSLEKNGGKAEAVRRGLLDAIASGAAVTGYLDADLATPPEEMIRILNVLADPRVHVAMGARVSLLGRRIERSTMRHYLGRIFASAASMLLQMRVYDTQCGAKALRVTPALRAALAQPFLSRWAFDVELIGRLLAGGPDADPLPVPAFAEVPLSEWRDVKGSKLTATAMARAASDLGRIQADLARRRARSRAPHQAG